MDNDNTHQELLIPVNDITDLINRLDICMDHRTFGDDRFASVKIAFRTIIVQLGFSQLEPYPEQYVDVIFSDERLPYSVIYRSRTCPSDYDLMLDYVETHKSEFESKTDYVIEIAAAETAILDQLFPSKLTRINFQDFIGTVMVNYRSHQSFPAYSNYIQEGDNDDSFERIWN